MPDGAARRDIAWGLIRSLLPGVSLTNPCVHCGGPHGAVRVHRADAVASVSYAGGFAVVAAASGVEAIGVDAEGAHGAHAGLESVLWEGASVRDWVRVEAVLKADGRGVRVDPAAVGIRASPDGCIGRVFDRDAEYEVTDAEGPPGLVISVALSATTNASVVRDERDTPRAAAICDD